MELNRLIYPWFEANQVLTPEQLNGVFAHLDEQGRATRANLIGIGIACGLDVGYDAKQATIELGAGVGVTSEGYLIVEQEPVVFTSRRSYTLPPEYGYQPFIRPGSDPEEQFALWELLEDAPAGSESLADVPPEELAGQAVLLFLELRKDGLRNCGPNACDDLGSEVTATLRRLLIGVDDLQRLLDAVGDDDRSAAGELGDRLRLPDLRMPRLDVPNTTPVTSEEVLQAFHRPFRRPDLLASATGAALGALYRALKGLVIDDYPRNPFQSLIPRITSLERGPKDADQVRRLQHYWDLFDDLIAAYDELRWKAVDLLCVCCPPARLFPRHLMAGLLDASGRDPAAYRHAWRPSPAGGDCEARTVEVRTLFRRLATMVDSFTARPPEGVRITPSRWAAPLSAKAIPYYYEQSGSPRLHEVWDPEKTARGRASQNLGYRSGEYAPPAPEFVTAALRYELAPNDFLRVEGHLGQNVWTVMGQLLALRRTNRLPFQVVALRTGAFDEDVEIDLTREQCRFQDVEALYDALAAELSCFLVKEVTFLYDLPFNYGVDRTETEPALAFLRLRASGFAVKPRTLGRWIDDRIEKVRDASMVAGDWQSAAEGLIAALVALGDTVSDDLRQLDAAEFRARYEELQEAASILRELALDKKVKGLEVLPGRLDDILFRCRLAPFQAIADEYRRRVVEAKQAQFLGHFLERHPGIQHKAGVPLGGTLVLVYHELAKPIRMPPRRPFVPVSDTLRDALTRPLLESPLAPTVTASGLSHANLEAIQEVLARLPLRSELSLDSDIQLLYRNLTGKVLTPSLPVPDEAATIYSRAVADLPAGTVIADFFLPYASGSDCGSMVYQLPAPPLRVRASLGCTNGDGIAEVTLTAEGARGDVSVQVGGGDFQPLDGPRLLPVGRHSVVVRDSAGTESDPVEVAVPEQLKVDLMRTVVDEAAGSYRAELAITGGVPPYTVAARIEPVDPGVAGPVVVDDETHTSRPIPIGSSLRLAVIDSARCMADILVESPTKPCELPCDGEAVREGFRFWLPQPVTEITVQGTDVHSFVIVTKEGDQIDLTHEAAGVVGRAGPIDAAGFKETVSGWLEEINLQIAKHEKVGSSDWVRLEYRPPENGRGFGALFIDRLVCLGVVLELTVGYELPGDEAAGEPRHERGFYFGYDSGATNIKDVLRGGLATIPVFDVSESNKCRPEEPPKQRCVETDLDVKILRRGVNPARFFAEASGNDQPAGYLWEFPGGDPSLSDQKEVDVTFDKDGPKARLIQLTVVSERGCVVRAELLVNVSEEG